MPLAPEAVVIGSHVQYEFAVQVAMEFPGDARQAAEATAQALVRGGWREGRSMRPRGGFVPSAMGALAFRPFCDDRRRRMLTLSAGTGDGGRADVRLSLNSDPSSYRPPERQFPGPLAESLFPDLTPPPGMRMHPGGGGGGGGSSHINATLFGEMGAEAIERHFREQLVVAGWKADGIGAGGRWAWSTWDFAGDGGEAWTALLTVVEPPNLPAIRHVSLSAASETARRGAFSISTMSP